MRTTIPNDLLAAVQRAVEALSADGIEGWGLQVAPQLCDLGEIVVVAPSDGCTSETCSHLSHDPAAPTVRWVPRDGIRVVHLGAEQVVDDMSVDYYVVLVDGRDPLYVERTDPAHFWAKLAVVEEDDVPEWALATLVEVGD